jgi:predicted adenine nucleotide alpha hydrolase (AANH) superfamily ATPase
MVQQTKSNYQKELDKLITGLNGKVPTLLLHACCAPCSSYVLEYLSNYFKITIFFYNPNISPEEEYRKRVAEAKRLIAELPAKHPIQFEAGTYDTERFYALSKGREQEPEGGERCFACYALRLNEAALAAKAGGYDYFTTTLSISPYKNAQKLNEIGAKLEKQYGVSYLYSDFKKKNGYKRSVELSGFYHLYRQDYCGCVFSKAEYERRTSVQNFLTQDTNAVENFCDTVENSQQTH